MKMEGDPWYKRECVKERRGPVKERRGPLKERRGPVNGRRGPVKDLNSKRSEGDPSLDSSTEGDS